MPRKNKKTQKSKKKYKKGRIAVLSTQDFIDLMNKKAQQYKKEVLGGNKIVGKQIINAVKRSNRDQKDKKFVYRQDKVDEAFKFLSYTKIPIKGNPEQFILTDYQAWIVSELFGWYKEDGYRKYRYGLIYTARKSGKTMFSVALMALLSFYDGEYNSEVYFLATTREQASIGLKYLKGIVKDSPKLDQKAHVRSYDITHSLSGEAIIKPLAAVADTLDGLNPNAAIIDEYHSHSDPSLYNIIKSGTLSRENPMILITSTAGFSKDYPLFAMLDQGRKVLNQEIDNDSMFYALYELDEDDDIEDQENWPKANPNLGQSIPLNALNVEWDQAKISILEKRNFIVKNLNIYLDGIDQWIEDEDYVKCFNTIPIEEMRGWKAWGGLDLASTRDLASLVWIVENPETLKRYVVPEFYFPQNESKKIRPTGIDLAQWIDKGYIIEHDQKTIDYKEVFKRVKYYDDIFDIQKIGYDKWNSSQLIQDLEIELGIICEIAPQTVQFFNYPLKWLEREILSSEISLSKNPVLRWNFRNIVLWEDGNGNVKIAKNKSQDSVDGAVSLGMAAGMWLSDNFSMEGSFFELYNESREDNESNNE